MIESSAMIGLAERDLPSDTRRAGHDPGQAGPRPGLAAHPICGHSAGLVQSAGAETLTT